MFGWEFPPNISGGLGTACYDMTKSLVKVGVEVLFVVPNKYEGIAQNGSTIIGANQTDIDIREPFFKEYYDRISFLKINSNIVPYFGKKDYYNLINNYVVQSYEQEDLRYRRFDFSGLYNDNLPQEVEKYAFVASQIARNNSFDIIHCHDWLTYKAGIIAKKVSGKPLVIHAHATEFDRSGQNVNKYVYDIEKQGMDAADKIITVSNYTRKIVIERYHQNPSKVITVYNGVTHSDKNYKHQNNAFNKKIVTFLGRVTFQKGPDYFVEAADKVLKKDKDIVFVLAGSGDMLNRMVALVAKKHISKNFFFTGFLNSSEVEKMFEMSDVYVMPSVSEPFGISPLEAMREGVPTIISKQSGVSEIVSYAIKVDFWDIDAMADAIYGLTHYEALSKTITSNASKEILKINWNAAATKIQDIYNELVNK